MKFLSSLIADIEALKTKNLGLADELAKARDFFEGKASADGAAKVKAQNAATVASVTDLHTQVDATLSEAKAHLDSVATTPAPAPTVVPDVVPATMRAKMLVTHVSQSKSPDGQTVYGEQYGMTCVGGDKVQKGYPADGTDEDNTFAKWSPSGNFTMSCNNPALFGKIAEGEKYYLDFTLANPAPVAVLPEPVAPPAAPVIAPPNPAADVPIASVTDGNPPVVPTQTADAPSVPSPTPQAATPVNIQSQHSTAPAN